jgi:hypothetical protein
VGAPPCNTQTGHKARAALPSGRGPAGVLLGNADNAASRSFKAVLAQVQVGKGAGEGVARCTKETRGRGSVEENSSRLQQPIDPTGRTPPVSMQQWAKGLRRLVWD